MNTCHSCKQPVESHFIATSGRYWHLECHEKEMTNASPSDVISIVKKMREKQKTYFLTRNKTTLRESISLEREVDECLEFYKPCPKCGRESFQDPCFQFIYCEFCSYCIHPSCSGGVCDVCGKGGI